MQIESYCARLDQEEQSLSAEGGSQPTGWPSGPADALPHPFPLVQTRGKVLTEIKLLGVCSYISLSCHPQKATERISHSPSTAFPVHHGLTDLSGPLNCVPLLLNFVSLVIGSVLGTREASEGVNADVAGCKAPCT